MSSHWRFGSQCKGHACYRRAPCEAQRRREDKQAEKFFMLNGFSGEARPRRKIRVDLLCGPSEEAFVRRCAESSDTERRTKKAEEPLSWDDIASCVRTAAEEAAERHPVTRDIPVLAESSGSFERTPQEDYRKLARSAGSKNRDRKSTQEERTHTSAKTVSQGSNNVETRNDE